MRNFLTVTLWSVTLAVGIPVLCLLGIMGTIVAIGPFTGKQPEAIRVLSPSGRFAAVKQYELGMGEDHDLYISVVRSTRRGRDSTHILNLSDFTYGNQDGIIVGWRSDHQLTVGWPTGKTVVHGPTRVGDIDINYTQFDPDLQHVPNSRIRHLELRDVAVSFKEEDSDSDAIYAATRKSVPVIDCIIRLSGTDGHAFDGINLEIIGHGIGRAGDRYASFGTTGIRYTVSPLSNGGLSTPTLTQAQIGDILRVPTSRSDAPMQEATSIYYHDYGPDAVIQTLSNIAKGHLSFRLGFGLGLETLQYDAQIFLDSQIIGEFNACSAKTNIYGRPFSIPPDL